ncbi:hypothetical protein CASFOL_017253 [Castilleja foliolosa]|uniref:DUF4283 domain-containing protein n=1 Tax=Castilleja foliolosa TaxID=1961234 RepID=A0ABD3DCP0_9LAMI
MNPTLEINTMTENLHIQCPDSNQPNKITPNQTEQEFTLIAKILSQKPLNLNAFKSSIIKAWNPKKKITTNILESNTVAFVFEDESDLDKVHNLSWTFRDHQIILAKWNSDQALGEVNLTSTIFWIQVFGIPVCYMNQNTARIIIGNEIGTFCKADLQLASNKWKKSLRIQIKLDITKPLTSFIILSCGDRPGFRIEIRYERLSDFCYNCGLLGHKIGRLFWK